MARAPADDRCLDLSVSADGVGGADATGAGLRGLADRIEALAGTLNLDSPGGRGTRIRAQIPLASQGA